MPPKQAGGGKAGTKPSTPAATTKPSTPASKGSPTSKAAQPKAATSSPGAGGSKGAKQQDVKKGPSASKEKKGGPTRTSKGESGNDSDSDASVKSNTSVKSNFSVKSNSSVKSNKSNADGGKKTKTGSSSASVEPPKIKGVTEVTGKQLLIAVTDFDKRSLESYIEFHKEAGPLSDDVINTTNNGGNTPLMMACQKPKDDDAVILIKLLMELKPDLNKQSRSGWTALHYASASNGLPGAAQLLLEAGADFLLKNSEGHTPLDLAKEKRVTSLLRHHLELKMERDRLAAIAELGVVLYEAVKTNDLKKVQTVINREPPPETYVWYPPPDIAANPPPLRLAIDKNLMQSVRLLVAAGGEAINKHASDRLGRTCLIYLCAQKRVPSYPTTKNSRDKEAIRWAMLQAMLDGPLNHLECRDKNGETAFHHAATNAYHDDLRLLAEVGADVNARVVSQYPYRGYPSQREKNGDTALIVAARKGDLDTVKVLLQDCKADVNLHGAEGLTALMWAAWHDRKEMIKYLHDHGADINAQSYFGQTALMWTAEHMRLETAMFLLDLGYGDPVPEGSSKKDKGASGKGKGGRDRSKSPDKAKSKGKGGLMGSMFGGGGKKSGAKVEAEEPPPSDEGRPPRTVGLPPRAADPNIVTKNNASPLVVIARKAKLADTKLVSACIDLLISRGANVDIRSTDGLTALMWAVINGDKDICRQLLFVGADPTIKDTLKHTPLDLALNTQIRMLLKSAVEAFAEAQKEKERREAEIAAEMAASLARSKEEEERKEREAIESAAKAIEDELRKQRDAEDEVNQLKKKKKKSVEASGPVKRPSIKRTGSVNAQRK